MDERARDNAVQSHCSLSVEAKRPLLCDLSRVQDDFKCCSSSTCRSVEREKGKKKIKKKSHYNMAHARPLVRNTQTLPHALHLSQLMRNHGVSDVHTSAAGIWRKLSTLYNLEGGKICQMTQALLRGRKNFDSQIGTLGS